MLAFIIGVIFGGFIATLVFALLNVNSKSKPVKDIEFKHTPAPPTYGEMELRRIYGHQPLIDRTDPKNPPNAE